MTNQPDQYKQIDFNILDIEESERMNIKEYEEKIQKDKSNLYISFNTKFNDPVGFIDDSYESVDSQSYSRMKEEFSKNKECYNNVLKYAEKECYDAYTILKDYKPAFLKRFGEYEYPI